jgi:hypothetical protein
VAREVAVVVPLDQAATLDLLGRAAAALDHQFTLTDITTGTAEIRIDITFRTLSTFRVSALTTGLPDGFTALRLTVRPDLKLIGFTGAGQSERAAWQIVGKMQELLDPERYNRLRDGKEP